MPTYHIEHHASEDFLVYHEDSLLLKVSRRRGWDGVLRSEFFLGERRILAASLSELFWTWKLKVTFADPAFSIVPQGKGAGKFTTPFGTVEVKRRALRNPVRTFLVDGRPVGTASMNMRKSQAPFEYTVELEGPAEQDIFVLLAMLLSESDMMG